jgi:hypothetical protein
LTSDRQRGDRHRQNPPEGQWHIKEKVDVTCYVGFQVGAGVFFLPARE